MTKLASEVAARADFSAIRYAQCWEDADILLSGLAVQPGDHCLSIASAGDNTLALLTARPGRVVALDLSPAQIACLELRVAAYRRLSHPELLELMGSRPSQDRAPLYARCRPLLTDATRAFWDGRPAAIAAGIGSAGKFERYFALFRRWVLPLIHGRSTRDSLLQPRSPAEREQFYREHWDTWRWRGLFALFFSRAVMGRMGRDPAFFRHVEGPVSARIRKRAEHAMTVLDPAANPYLHWILTGTHGEALPLALRPEHFDTIRSHLDRLTWHQQSVEEYLSGTGQGERFDRYNLSDIFEYQSEEASGALLERLVDAGRPGGRLLYWNMLVPRAHPPRLDGRVRRLHDLGRDLHAQDKAFFYSDLVVEELL
jgi:S-adenosylmethionine-diacylglycerol 3-amino-3-carboxypropyl transferase